MKGGGGMQIDSSILEGLGYGGVGAETTGKMPLLGGAGDMSDDDELFEGLATGSNPVGYLSKGRALSPDDEGENTGFPDQTSLRGIQERLDALNAARSSGEGEVLAQRDELAGMVNWLSLQTKRASSADGHKQVKSLLAPALEQLPFLQGQVDAQRDTIVTIQDQAKLSEQLMKVERCVSSLFQSLLDSTEPIQ